jgi:hypothetical protein
MNIPPQSSQRPRPSTISPEISKPYPFIPLTAVPYEFNSPKSLKHKPKLANRWNTSLLKWSYEKGVGDGRGPYRGIRYRSSVELSVGEPFACVYDMPMANALLLWVMQALAVI